MRTGALQCDLAMHSGVQMALDQANTVRSELVGLDNMVNESRQASQFRTWTERWNAETFEERMAEMTDLSKKGDLLSKVLKQMLIGLKGDNKD